MHTTGHHTLFAALVRPRSVADVSHPSLAVFEGTKAQGPINQPRAMETWKRSELGLGFTVGVFRAAQTGHVAARQDGYEGYEGLDGLDGEP
ncbi:uncharacterized protein EHS24_008415 [Apiotrichum porosum]|uniref:Uncharacterized protein n=1 Tax=Apiotrichum porosum TaxID=105984 RepID=A0A427XQ55_9TREE|nr:uncharacterized protein EHS24_008415 [Apiotrichum porosum]RSH80984.1 hypothetical protein EHS24_008415 [Apiotrichum porosum]